MDNTKRYIAFYHADLDATVKRQKTALAAVEAELSPPLATTMEGHAYRFLRAGRLLREAMGKEDEV